MSYKCEKCKVYVKENTPQSKIYKKIKLDEGSRIIGEICVCFSCFKKYDEISGSEYK